MPTKRPEPTPAHSVREAFETALLRFKLQAGLRTDRDVADLLGMSEKAFGSRKRRGAFPEDKVLALAVRRPYLQIDAHYVLTGERLTAPTTGGELMHPEQIRPMTTKALTPAQVKERFRQRGETFSQWARDNGYSVNKVHRVMAGIEKGHYGQAHEIAVRLGLKVDPSKVTSLKPVKPAEAPPPAEAIPGLEVTEIFGERAA